MAFKRESVIRSAEKYVSRGKIEAAIKEYRKVLAENPNDANTLNRVGDLYARIERFDEAVRLFSQIAEQYTHDGFFVKAIAIYKKIIKLDPTALQVYEKLAALYGKQGLVTEARTQYQVLADYYQKHDNAASAITIYQRMAELEPDNPSYRLKLADLYTSRRLHDKALVELNRLADIFIVNGSLDEAAQVFLKALDTSASDLGFVRHAVEELRRHGQDAAAARVLAKAVELNPEAAKLASSGGPEAPPAAAGLDESTPPVDFSDAPTEVNEAGPGALDEIALDPVASDVLTFDGALDTPDTSSDVYEIDLGEFEADAVGPSGDESTAEADAPAAAPSGPISEIFTFELDLDDEEVPESLVMPPSDMIEVPDEGVASAMHVDVESTTLPFAEPSTEEDIETPSAEASDVFVVDLEELEAGDLLGAEVDDSEDPTVASAAEAPAPAAAEPEAFRFEIELDDEALAETLGAEDEIVEPLMPPGMATPAPLPGSGIEMSAVRREEDLLAEAQVFAKYGLRQKAEERLETLFALRENHLGGLVLATRIYMQAGEHAEALERATVLREPALQAGQGAAWSQLVEEMAVAGYTIDGDAPIAVPGDRPSSERISNFLERIDNPAPAPPRPRRSSLSDADLDRTLAGLLDETRPPRAKAKPKPPRQPDTAETEIHAAVADIGPRPAEGPPVEDVPPIADEEAVGDAVVDPAVEAGAEAAVEAEAAAPSDDGTDAKVLDDSSLSWLDDVSSEPAAAPASDEEIFAGEDDFFDLAAELERELSEDDTLGDLSAEPQEQSLEDIVEGFKRGVAEHLSPEDYDTHFNLGIAYREMGLLDEAIGEFQLASKDDRHLVEASSMLGICFLDKGIPELALKWYRKGLAAPTIGEDETLGLLYEMANVYVVSGDRETARETYVEIYGMNSNFRDVAGRLAELEAEGS